VKITDVFKVKELINLALSSIKSLGVKVGSIDSENIIRATPHLILGILWQLVKILLIKDIDLNKVPEILRLKEGEEEMDDLIKLDAEKLLVRWMNWHLNNAGSKRRIANLGKDLSDGEVYTIVLNQIDPSCISTSSLQKTPEE